MLIIGVTKTQITVLPDGTRASTAKVFLRPAMARDNLHVAVDAFVTKVSGLSIGGCIRLIKFPMWYIRVAMESMTLFLSW